MPSRKLEDLDTRMRPLVEQLVAECQRVGIDLLVTCTYRSNREQAEAYAQGRSTPGAIITNAKPGQSKHNITGILLKPASTAVDVVPLRLGKCVWDTNDPVWQTVARIGEEIGLEWAGRWVKMREMAHFQMKD